MAALMIQTAIVLLMLAATCAGCAARRAAEPAASPLLAVLPGPDVAQSITAAMIFPLEPGETRFALLDKNGQAGESTLLRREPTSNHNARIAAKEGDRRIEFLAQDERGNIVLTAVIECEDNALTLFDPPLIVAPPALDPGQTFESEAAIRVVRADNPGKQRERGSAKRTITYVKDALVRTPRGEAPAARIDIHFTADLRMADADERTTLYISRESGQEGVILSDSREKVTILGAFPRETHRILLRDER